MKNTLLFILAILLFSACRKDDTPDPLSKYRLKEYTRNQYRYTYEYDSLNRIVKSGTYYDGGFVFNTYYFYAGNRLDSLISCNQDIMNEYQTFRYTGDTLYQVTGRFAFNDRITIKYAIHDNLIEKIVPPDCVMGDSSFPCNYKVLHWDNNNLTYKYIYNSAGGMYPDYKSSGNLNEFQMSSSVWTTYDNHPNPLKFLYQQAFPGDYACSDNNLKRMVITDLQGDTLVRNFQHTYNGDGLPLTTIETQEKNNTTLNEVIELHTYTSTYTYEKYR